jgi:hypothetical protein
MRNRMRSGRMFQILAIVGSIGFAVFYVLAAVSYPGGSDAHPSSIHFSFLENYWCDLLSTYSKNGSINNGKPYAIAAQFFLNVTLLSTWIFNAGIRESIKSWNVKLVVTGIFSTLFSNFVSTPHHDLYIALSALFGLLAVLQILSIHRKIKRPLLFITGIVGLVLIGLNCLLYYFDFAKFLLPLLQKITFAYMLIWFMSNLKKNVANETNQ